MKIILLTPNTRSAYVRSIPLGLLYIAASLREAGFSDIRIIDSRIHDLTHKVIVRRIKDFAPDVVGISAMSLDSLEVHELAGLVKGINPQSKVVVGGAYATSSPECIIQDPHIDFVVMGEGERTACNLMDALENGKDVSGIDGLAFKHNGKPIMNPQKIFIENIDSLPFPAWNFINLEGYFNNKNRHSENPTPASNRIAPLFTSRGCPFGCTYCHNIFGKKVRLRSVQNVIEEIELLIKKHDVGEIEIIDDIFNFDLTRAKQICDEIVKRGIKIKLSFPNGLRVDAMDEELIVKLKQAGTHLIFYAIESASARVQKRIRKNLDLDKVRRIIQYTAQQGIIVGGFFMLGFPEETKDEMLQTIRFARELPFLIADFFYVTPRPNTPLFEEMKSKYRELDELSIHQYHVFSFNASAVSDAELKKIRARAFREFYLRPAQLWRICKTMPNKKTLLWYAFVMFKRCITGTGVY